MYGRSKANKNRGSQKSITFQKNIYGTLTVEGVSVKISESCILSIQFYAGSKFCVINTIPPP